MTQINKYEGDPKIYIDGSGAYIKWLGGQTIMDSGVENTTTLALLVSPGWPGNAFIRETEEKYGSRFLAATEQPITVSALNDIRAAGEASLEEKLVDDNLASEATVSAINPVGVQLQITVQVKTPGGTVKALQLEKYGPNWDLQHNQPAGAR